MNPKRNLKLKFAIIKVFGTQVKFAEKVKEHPTVVSCVVNGREILSRDRQIKYAHVLNKRVEDIF